MTPAKQIARFIERHPGEWSAFGDPATPDDRCSGYTLCLGDLRVNVFLTGWVGATYGEERAPVASLGPMDPRADRLTRIAHRVADAAQLYGISADTLPPWLADPVRRQLRTRAGELLTLAGSSPADVVSAAETLDEELCKRPVVEPTLSAVFAALQGIGMSCRWIRNPGDTGINPEREALEDARAGLACADDRMTREQYVDLFRDLRRVLGVTP